MTSYMVALVLLGFLLFLAALQRKMNATDAPARKGRFESRPPLTRKDQAMYQRLVEAFPAPAYIVLAGVSLSIVVLYTWIILPWTIAATPTEIRQTWPGDKVVSTR